MARNTGRGSVAGRPIPTFTWAKHHGGLLGRIPASCFRLGWDCPHVRGRSQPAEPAKVDPSGSQSAGAENPATETPTTEET